MSNIAWKSYATSGKPTVEEWCGACLAVPLAFAGVGASAYGADASRKNHATRKKIAFWGGIVSVILSLAIAVYYLMSCDRCR